MNGTNELLGRAVAPKFVTRLQGRTGASAGVSEPTVPAGVRLAPRESCAHRLAAGESRPQSRRRRVGADFAQSSSLMMILNADHDASLAADMLFRAPRKLHPRVAGGDLRPKLTGFRRSSVTAR